MEILDDLDQMRAWSRAMSKNGQRVGLVPTLGALHRGHQRLIDASTTTCGPTVVSVFVNPLQFGPNEDFQKYPRMLDADVRAATEAGAQVVFAPRVDQMYPDGDLLTRIDVGALGQILCGRSRPTHFSGVATVVVKLIHIVEPSDTFFGAKDAQQLAVVRRVVRDFNLPTTIHAVPTVRESDGLAMSSRNRYLNRDERRRASAIARGLFRAQTLYAQGERRQRTLIAAVNETLEADLITPEYVELRSWDALDTLPDDDIGEGPAILAVAARVGPSRLIDNLVFTSGARL